jgi:dipeptidyl aminopeptidase/acylaminoacyl peptidase
MSPWLDRLRTGLAAALLLCAGAAAGGPVPIEHFTKWPDIDDVSVSPSGKRVALTVWGPNGFKRVGVVDLDPVGQPRIVAAFGDADVTGIRWTSDDRLVYQAFQRGYEIKEGGAGTFAVNHDGTEPLQLIAWRYATTSPGTRITSRVLPLGWFLGSTTDDGSNEVFVYRVVRDSAGDVQQYQLARLNTSTGALRNLSEGMPVGTRTWLRDAKDEPRMLEAYREGRTTVYWRKAAGVPWEAVANFDPLTETSFSPMHVAEDDTVLVWARSGGDTGSLYRFDPATKQLQAEPLISVAGFDLSRGLVTDSQSNRLLGVHFTADRPMSYWFSADMQRIQKAVDTALAGRSNRLHCRRCETTRFFVVASGSDRQPGEYYLFDRTKSTLQLIGASRPWIDEASQGRRTFHRISARDGLSMPLYVTHPAGAAAKSALPAVVLVHGGPWIRGSNLGWHAEAQFLASRGYRVLEPEFRGSSGYGAKLFRAGWKEWGRAMQDDLEDAVQWAAKEGLVDPARVCIVGGSYGGYAALMGTIAHPKTYRCAAALAAVTDIELMYTITWSDSSEASRLYTLPVLIGDPEKEAQRLASVSPLQRASEIKVPVLLVHGGRDLRVPIDHARKFAAAAKRAGVAVEQVEYDGEAHGFNDPANHADYYRHLERFLDKALKPAQ